VPPLFGSIELRSLLVDVVDLFVGRTSVELETGPAAQTVYFANPTMLIKGRHMTPLLSAMAFRSFYGIFNSSIGLRKSWAGCCVLEFKRSA